MLNYPNQFFTLLKERFRRIDRKKALQVGVTAITLTAIVVGAGLKKAPAPLQAMVQPPGSFEESFQTHRVLSHDMLYLNTDLFDIVVDGQVIASLYYENEWNQVVEALVAPYVDKYDTIVSQSFVENVVVNKRRATIGQAMEVTSVEDLFVRIKDGGVIRKSYLVQEGDTLSEIAEKHGLKEAELMALNPDFAQKKYLQIGDTLEVTLVDPLINVVVEADIQYEEDIDPEIVVEKSADLYVGESRVKQSGQVGTKAVEARVTTVNGLESSRQITSETVLKNPTTEVRYTGTKPAPSTLASGNLSRPASGYVVYSRFGNRSMGYHTGIDLAMPTGSTVKAADGGTVVLSGNSGTYGLAIKIDHGKGVETLYAHNSKLLVKVGNKVFKGQQIALSGNTGRSTGPHLHFEVRVNDVPVNPEKYLNF